MDRSLYKSHYASPTRGSVDVSQTRVLSPVTNKSRRNEVFYRSHTRDSSILGANLTDASRAGVQPGLTTRGPPGTAGMYKFSSIGGDGSTDNGMISPKNMVGRVGFRHQAVRV